MVWNKKMKNVIDVRRRVYFLGIICMIMAVGQLAIYMIMLSFSVSEEYHDSQVATGSGLMAVGTGSYLGLTGRLLFLLYERRYEEVKGPEWLWWFASVGVVVFNIILVIWFTLLSDILPAVVCAIAVVLYSIFFIYASHDIKHISDNDEKGPKIKVKTEEDDEPGIIQPDGHDPIQPNAPEPVPQA